MHEGFAKARRYPLVIRQLLWLRGDEPARGG